MNAGPLSSNGILGQSCYEINVGLNGSISMHGMSDKNLTIRNTVYDQRGGVRYSNETCPTCKSNGGECTGHFGHIVLPYPILNKFYAKKNLFLQIMNCLCWECLEPLMEADDLSFEELKKLVTEPNNKKERKVKCNRENCKMNGVVQPFLSSMDGLGLGVVCSETNRKFSLRNLFRPSIEQAKHFQIKDLTTLYSHFNDVYSSDPEFYSRTLNLPPSLNPADFIMFYLPVLPPSLRPYTFSDGVNMNDDFITEIYNNIVSIIPDFKNPKNTRLDLIELQKTLNQHIYNLYYSGLKNDGSSYGDVRGIMVRIKDAKKPQIESKRGDRSARTVITPGEGTTIDIPNAISKNLGMTLQVTEENFKVVVYRASTEEVISIVRPPLRGIGKKFGIVTNLKGCITFKSIPRGGLKIGDFVTFRLKDGDILTNNRNPTLHAYGMMATPITTNSSRRDREPGENSLCVTDQVWGIDGVDVKTSVFNLVNEIVSTYTSSVMGIGDSSSLKMKNEDEGGMIVSCKGNFIDIVIPHSGNNYVVDDNVVNDLRKWCLTDIPCIYANSNIYGNRDVVMSKIVLDPFSVERVMNTMLSNYAKSLSMEQQSILISEGMSMGKISMQAEEGSLELSIALALMLQDLDDCYIIIPHPIEFSKASPRQKDISSCGIYRFSGSVYCRSISKFAINDISISSTSSEDDDEDAYHIRICTTLIHHSIFMEMLKQSVVR